MPEMPKGIDKVYELMEEARALRERVAALEEALRPLAALASDYEGWSDKCTVEGGVYISHLRKARTLLERKEAPSNG